MNNKHREPVSIALVTPQGVEFGRLNYIPAVLAAYRRSGAQRRLQARLTALKDASRAVFQTVVEQNNRAIRRNGTSPLKMQK